MLIIFILLSYISHHNVLIIVMLHFVDYRSMNWLNSRFKEMVTARLVLFLPISALPYSLVK